MVELKSTIGPTYVEDMVPHIDKKSTEVTERHQKLFILHSSERYQIWNKIQKAHHQQMS